jgi:hypothetical protein
MEKGRFPGMQPDSVAFTITPEANCRLARDRFGCLAVLHSVRSLIGCDQVK